MKRGCLQGSRCADGGGKVVIGCLVRILGVWWLNEVSVRLDLLYVNTVFMFLPSKSSNNACFWNKYVLRDIGSHSASSKKKYIT